MSRTLVAVALAAATAASSAAAYDGVSYFSFGALLPSSQILDLGIVRAEGAGTVDIYSLNGELLGSAPVSAGANGEVRVNVGTAPTQPVRAEINVNGQTVAEKIYRIGN